MARRKRLTPARHEMEAATDPAPAAGGGPLGSLRPPVAQVAADSAAASALEELSREWAAARAEGRLVQAIPQEAIEIGHLIRDRVASDAEEMDALVESLRQRGQQVPVDVVDLGGGRFGLISGWRRIAALRRLREETNEARFATVLARLRRPEGAAEAYLSMVEENEIRVGLTYYERARIAAKAAEQGVFDSEKAALLSLYAAASRPKRSKIRAFVTLYHALDAVLRFAPAIPERLGLALAKALQDDPALAARLKEDLARSPAATAAEELERLQRAVQAPQAPQADSEPRAEAPSPAAPVPPPPPSAPLRPVPPGRQDGPETEPAGSERIGGIEIRRHPNGKGLTLSGPGLTETLQTELLDWLARRAP